MKKILFMLTMLALTLAACAPSVTPTTVPEEVSVPVENNMPVPGMAVTEMVVEPQGKLPAPSFESQTYIDEVTGFALDYPATWTVTQTMTGDRGSQSILLSSPAIADLAVLPDGETRVSIDVNQWDPKNDLTAFVDMRKTAWEASGFTVLSEERLTLDLGLDAVRIAVQTSDGIPFLYQFVAIGDHYVTIGGEGDLSLVTEIMVYLRPIG